MKELDEMEKINAKLAAAVEEVTLEHCKKIEVILILILISFEYWIVTILCTWWQSPFVCLFCFHVFLLVSHAMI